MFVKTFLISTSDLNEIDFSMPHDQEEYDRMIETLIGKIVILRKENRTLMATNESLREKLKCFESESEQPENRV